MAWTGTSHYAPSKSRILRTLQAAIYKESAGDTTLPMIITADAQAAHQDVVRAMDAAGQMGFIHLSITTRQPAAPAPGDG